MPRTSTPGTPRFGGNLNTDTVYDAPTIARNARQVLRACPKVAAADNYLEGAILAGVWEWKPSRDTAMAKRLADHMNRACGLGGYRRGYMRRPWQQVVRSASKMRRAGWATADVMPTSIGLDGLHYPIDLTFPAPEALSTSPWQEHAGPAQMYGDPNRWGVTLYAGDLCGISQQDESGQTGCFLPERALHFRMDADAAEWDGGGGLLRPCFLFYELAVVTLRVLGVSTERWGGQGVPVVRRQDAKARELAVSPSDVDEQVAALLTLAEQFTTGARTALVATDVAYVDILASGFDSRALLAVLEFALEQMRAAYAAAQLDLGSTGTGSYNVGTTLRAAFDTIVGSIGEGIAATINGVGPFQGALFRCLTESYGALHPYGPLDPIDLPTVTVAGLREPRWVDYVSHMAGLLAAGAPEKAPAVWAAVQEGAGIDAQQIAEVSAEMRARVAEGALPMGGGETIPLRVAA